MNYDVVTVGRVNMDLFSQDVGVDFAEITGFDAAVGGSPTNIAIGLSRLGCASIAFTAVGEDRVGDFVLRYLRDEDVITDFVARKPDKQTSLALVGVKPPDGFPLTLYRADPADIYLTVADAATLPLGSTRAVLLSGNAFSRGTCVEAARFVAERARRAGMTTFMDLDLRPTDWTSPESYGLTLRTVLPLVDVAIGTEEEFFAALSPNPQRVMAGEPLSANEKERLDVLLHDLAGTGRGITVVVKRGPRGASVLSGSDRLDVEGFPVTVVNTVGAGDAFAAGLIWSRLGGGDWSRSARFANACGAIVVTRHGCSVAFPTGPELEEFVATHGGV